jgi:hypothetical protein
MHIYRRLMIFRFGRNQVYNMISVSGDAVLMDEDPEDSRGEPLLRMI